MNMIWILAVLISAPVLRAQAPGEGAPFAGAQARPGYRLGPGDQIMIRALDAEEISDKAYRIDMRGSVNLPMVGRVQAGGLTAEEFEVQLNSSLKPFIKRPQATVTVMEFRSQPVSILGAVNRPGVHQLEGRKTLLEVITMAEGLRQDAGNKIKITRRKEWGVVPVPGAAFDAGGQFSVGEVNVRNLTSSKTPEENIQIQPDDVVFVDRSELIYVIGSVRKSGGFVLNEHENMSVLQALSLSEGLDRTAAPQKAKILRALASGTSRTEIPVNLKHVLDGKANDVLLLPNDILFVPGSASRNIAIRSLEAALQIGTGIAIYRR